MRMKAMVRGSIATEALRCQFTTQLGDDKESVDYVLLLHPIDTHLSICHSPVSSEVCLGMSFKDLKN